VIAVGLFCGAGEGFLPASITIGLRRSNEHAESRMRYFIAEQD
jgi:hypothetical protein